MATVGKLDIRIGTVKAFGTLVANPFPRCNLTARARGGRHFAMAAETSGRVRWWFVRRGIVKPRVRVVAASAGAELLKIDARIRVKAQLDDMLDQLAAGPSSPRADLGLFP